VRPVTLFIRKETIGRMKNPCNIGPGVKPSQQVICNTVVCRVAFIRSQLQVRFDHRPSQLLKDLSSRVQDGRIKDPGGAHYSQDIGVEFAGKPESWER
jgi:hypothetical protein